MNSFISDAPLEQQAVTVEHLDKRIHELNKKIHELQGSIEYRIVNQFGSAGNLVVHQNILRNTKYECRDTQSKLIEALGPPVDSDDRLEKRLKELEGKLHELEGNFGFYKWNPTATVGNFQSTEASINTKLDEIRDIQAQLIEARRPPVDPVDCLQKRLRELEEQLIKLETNLLLADFNPHVTIGRLQSAKNEIKEKEKEIEDTKRQLTEAQRPRDAPQNDRVDNLTCCICLTSKSRPELFALVPCGHRCVCSGCAELMVNQPCPMCRVATIMAMRVFD